jgi:uncharacterized protein (TIGR02118 family)
MIRLVYALRRAPGLTREEFQEYWRRRHGPLVAGFAGDLELIRYVQTHTVASSGAEAARRARGTMEPEYDGVAELWWESESALESAMASEAGRAAGAALLEDERRFIDLPQSPLWLAHEYPQVNPIPENIVAHFRSPVMRIFYPLRALPSLGDTAARRDWLTRHGPLVRSHAEAAGVLCYRQVHRAYHPLDAALRNARGTQAPPYLGHAEIWFDQARMPTTEESRDAGRALVEDEGRFVDFSRSTMLFGKERTFVDQR